MDDSVSQEELDAGRGYENHFVPALFAPWPPHLVKCAKVQSGQSVLDVACGSGVLARHILSVVGDSGHVTGLDPAPGMIAAAREVEPRIDWVLAGAEDTGLENEAYDAVLSQFGMMFFRDRDAAAQEMHRILRPGGALAIAVWNDLDHNPAYHAIIKLLETEISTAAGNALRLPYSLGNAAEVVSIYEKAGFLDIEVVTDTEPARFPNARTMVEADLRGWLPLFDIHLSEEKIASVLACADDALEAFRTADGEVVFQASAYIVSGRKP